MDLLTEAFVLKRCPRCSGGKGGGYMVNPDCETCCGDGKSLRIPAKLTQAMLRLFGLLNGDPVRQKWQAERACESVVLLSGVALMLGFIVVLAMLKFQLSGN